MNEEHDINELRAALQEAKQSRPPKDSAPRELRADDAKPLPTGPGQTVTVTEWDENGVTYTESEAFITRAITDLDDLYRRNDNDD